MAVLTMAEKITPLLRYTRISSARSGDVHACVVQLFEPLDRVRLLGGRASTFAASSSERVVVAFLDRASTPGPLVAPAVMLRNRGAREWGKVVVSQGEAEDRRRHTRHTYTYLSLLLLSLATDSLSAIQSNTAHLFFFPPTSVFLPSHPSIIFLLS